MSGPQVESLCCRGRELMDNHDYAGAIEVFKEAVKLDPDFCDAHEGWAECAFMAGDYPVAISEYQKLTLLAPSQGSYYTNLGAIHNRMGEYMKACDYLRKAIQRNKKCAESYYNLGIAQRKLKQNSMAVSAYKEAIRIAPTMAEAHQNLGNTYLDMGNLQMAVACFKKALDLRPEFEKARIGLEKAQAQQIEAKNRNTQFVRLNSIESTITTVAPIVTRELDDDERFEDRKCIKHLSEDIEHIAKDCVDYLKHKMAPAILEVERAMAVRSEDLFELRGAAETFKEATSQWAALRGSLTKKLNELAAHEKEFV